MSELPTGTLTFLFTDVEGSTRMWEEYPREAGRALARHDELIESLVAAHAGSVVRPRGEGDSRFCVFEGAADALAAALAVQSGLAAEEWPVPKPLKIRLALHTGEAELRAGDYYGSVVNRCARLRGIAHGGQTLLSHATAELVADVLPEGATLLDLGEHLLRDLSHPERVFQLCHPSLESEFPPLLSLDERRNNLPSELTSFVGRQREVQEVKRLMQQARLLTLQGTAGCGKTRLALEVADELIGSFRDGVWFVDLAPIRDAALVEDAVASAIGLSERDLGPGQSRRDQLLEHLRARVCLLLLDNCEHLVAPAASLLEDVLRACPDVRVVTTSRETLAIPSEVVWKVPSMSLPPAEASITYDELSSFEACKLFVERARQRRADLRFDEEDAGAIASICRRLDGIPLAIELAAARVKMLTPRQIDDRLGERFRLLVGGSRTALERQQTLRATVDWSYEPLEERERALFRRLGVFAGRFTLADVEAVCTDDLLDAFDALDVLTQLVDKSLVEAEPIEDDVRYRMLETFRQYAREKMLEEGETEFLRVRHREHFLAVAERAAPEVEAGDQVAALDRLEAVHDDLRAALDWSVAEEGTDHSARFVGALGTFWYLRGHITEGRQWCDQVLARDDELPPTIEADMLRTASALAMLSYDMEAVPVLVERWHAAALASDDRLRLGRALIGIGNRALFAGDVAAAEEAWADAEVVAREIDDTPLLINALALLARVDLLQGRQTESTKRYRNVIELALDGGDLTAVAAAHEALANAARDAGEYGEARQHLQECLEIGRRLRDPIQIGAALLGLSALARSTGDTDRARELLEEGRTMRIDGGVLPQMWILELAKIEETDRAWEQARELYEQARDEGERRKIPGVAPSAIEGLARVAVAEGRDEEALGFARDAIRGWMSHGVRAGYVDALAIIAGCWARGGRARRAAKLFAAVEAVRREQGQAVHPHEADRYEGDIGRARRALDDAEFDAAWDAGGAMSLETAVALALESHPGS